MGKRSPMPEIARFVDVLCEAFGADEIDAIVRRGRDGEPVFYAREAGIEYGTRLPAGRGSCATALEERYFCEGCAGKCLETGIRCSEHRARTARGGVR